MPHANRRGLDYLHHPRRRWARLGRARRVGLPAPTCNAWFGDLAKWLPEGQGACLDLGCAAGRHKEAISDRGYTWVGLDVQIRTSDPCRRSGMALYAGGHFPFQGDCFEAVFSCQVLEHVEDPPSLVRECHRVLKPGGLLLGSSSFLEPVHDADVFQNFAPSGIRSLLRSAGFESVQVTAGIHGPVLMVYNLYGRALARVLGPVVVGLFWLRCLAGYPVSRASRGPGEGLLAYVRRKALASAGHLIWAACAADDERWAEVPQGDRRVAGP